MNLKKYILLTGLLVIPWLSAVLSQDYLDMVCPGDTGRFYYVQGHEGSTYSWSVQGGVITHDYGDSIYVDWGMEPGEYEIRIREKSVYGCYSEPKFGKVLIGSPSLELGEDAFICEGEIFTLTPEGNYASIEWHDGSSSGTYTTSDEGLISAIVTDEAGCTIEDEMYLEVKPLPYVDLGRDTSLCGDEFLYLNAGSDGVNYQWSTGDVSQEIQVFKGFQEISVEVEDMFGCVNRDRIVINDCDLNDYFSDIMTAITPGNQDGRNDYWVIEKLQAYPDAIVEIYDRWGRLTWRSAPGYPAPWDGKNMSGKDVPMDSYHFIIMLNYTNNGNDDRVTGSVTVIR